MEVVGWSDELERRARVHAALGEPARLAIVDRLVPGDASPGGAGAELGLATNLLAHHLRVLQEAGVIRRVRSEGDRRRAYVQLRLDEPWCAPRSPRPRRWWRGTAGGVRLHPQFGPFAAGGRVMATGQHGAGGLRPAPIPARPGASGCRGRRSSARAAAGPSPHRARRPGSGADRPGRRGLRQRARGTRPRPAAAALVDPGPGPGRYGRGVRRRLRGDHPPDPHHRRAVRPEPNQGTGDEYSDVGDWTLVDPWPRHAAAGSACPTSHGAFSCSVQRVLVGLVARMIAECMPGADLVR